MSDTSTANPARRSLINLTIKTPDVRALIVMGVFGLAIYIIHLLAQKPELGDNKLFFALAVAIASGALGSIVGFYFGASKGGASVLENQGKS